MFALDYHQLELCTEYNTAANNYECGYNGMDRLSKLFNRRVKKDGEPATNAQQTKKHTITYSQNWHFYLSTINRQSNGMCLRSKGSLRQ